MSVDRTASGAPSDRAGVGRTALKARWDRGEITCTAWVGLPGQINAETMAALPWDTLGIDMQHGPISHNDAIAMLPAILRRGITPLVRVPSPTSELIAPMLDSGAYGIVGPQIDTPEIAQAFVSACRYPPEGVRSFAPFRISLTAGGGYLDEARRAILTIGILESQTAMDNLEAILATPGLDVVWLGIQDLGISRTGEPDIRAPGMVSYENFATREAAETVLRVARQYDVAVGLPVMVEEDLQYVLKVRPQMLLMPPDYHFIMAGGKAALDTVDKALEAAGIPPRSGGLL